MLGNASGPQQLSLALSELVALRGLARVGGHAQLQSIWNEVAGAKLALHTRVLGIKRGVLQIAVGNAPLLAELISFHKASLLQSVQARQVSVKICDLKFHLQSDISPT